MSGRLKGKVALITGAASGIGRATADLFVREGARVVAADIQEDKGARMVEEHGDKLRFIRCNVMEEGDIRNAVEKTVSAFGRIDVLFNNAGAPGAMETADTVTTESFDNVMHMHVLAAMLGMKYAVPHMRNAGGGSIISTASIAGLQNGFGPILYSVAKGAIVHMTKLAAAQLGPEALILGAGAFGRIDEHRVMLALDLRQGIAEGGQEVFVGGGDPAVQFELDHGLGPLDGGHLAPVVLEQEVEFLGLGIDFQGRVAAGHVVVL